LLGRDNLKSKKRKIKSRENQNRSRNMGKQVSEILESLLGEFKIKKKIIYSSFVILQDSISLQLLMMEVDLH